MRKDMTFSHIAITLSALGAIGLGVTDARAESALPASVSAFEVDHAVSLGNDGHGDHGDKDAGKNKDNGKNDKQKKTAKKKKGKKAGSCGAKGGCGAGTCGS